VPAILDAIAGQANTNVFFDHPRTNDSHFWDAALFYTADWNSIKLSAAYAYTWLQSNPLNGGEEDIHQIGGSIMHKPSGLGIYAMGEWEITSNSDFNCPGAVESDDPQDTDVLIPPSVCLVGDNLPDTDMWGVKPFWRKAWTALGATTLYAEYAQYNDMYGLALAQGVGTLIALPGCPTNDCIVTGSQVDRWGLGVVQEIDSAAMHLWLRWQHQDFKDLDLVDPQGNHFSQDFDDFDLIQAGGIIFF
jgi:hypothetical protein